MSSGLARCTVISSLWLRETILNAAKKRRKSCDDILRRKSGFFLQFDDSLFDEPPGDLHEKTVHAQYPF